MRLACTIKYDSWLGKVSRVTFPRASREWLHPFLTSDHGNIEAVGAGRPREGAIAEVRGERVRIYSDDVLRARMASRFPAAFSWPPIGLPNDFLPLLAPERQAFTLQGSRTVTHGGTTLDEIIVAFIRIHGDI